MEEFDNLATENEILKAKISEYETKVNTLSRDDCERVATERAKYEQRINLMVEEA